jgi:hypothetical protein
LIFFVPLDGDKFKFEDASPRVIFFPAIYEVKVAVVRPDSGSNFLINAHDIGTLFANLELLLSCGKLAVLGEPPRGQELRLVEHLRDW